MTLTERQYQVVALIARGRTFDEIALELELAPRTAKAHADNLRVKLGAAHVRQIPGRYRELTGRDPFAAANPRARNEPAVGCLP